jgi:hypothetical protein
LAEELATIAALYDWAKRRSIGIEERLLSGNGLMPNELQALLDHLRFSRPFGRSVADRQLHLADSERIVSSGVHRSRILVVRDFLVWAMDHTLSTLDVGDDRYRHIAERRDRIWRIADSYELSTRTRGREGLPSALRARFVEIISPSYRANPFNKSVRFRNYILLMLFLMFGFRRGETCRSFEA